MGQISLALRSVPSLDVAPSRNELPVTDLTVSPALRDFLIRGTNKDPSLLRRRAELSELGDQGDADAAIIEPNEIRVYRATKQSTVQLQR